MAIEVDQRRTRGCGEVGAPRLLRSLVITVLLLSWTSCTLSTQARAQTPDEYQVKAALLFNFIKFVEWPQEAFNNDSDPIVIGVIGDDPFGSALDQAISGKAIHGRSLIARRLRWGQDVRACHILFISSSERKRLPQIINSLQGASILTVSDMRQSNQPGGIINFIMEASKVRFEINAGVAGQARLKISAKLLALAKNVRN
jgi:hypothetical protein